MIVSVSREILAEFHLNILTFIRHNLLPQYAIILSNNARNDWDTLLYGWGALLLSRGAVLPFILM